MSEVSSTPPTIPNLVRLPLDPVCGDPLVRSYLEEHRETCAFRVLSWAWLLIGLVGCLLGGLLASGGQVLWERTAAFSGLRLPGLSGLDARLLVLAALPVAALAFGVACGMRRTSVWHWPVRIAMVPVILAGLVLVPLALSVRPLPVERLFDLPWLPAWLPLQRVLSDPLLVLLGLQLGMLLPLVASGLPRRLRWFLTPAGLLIGVLALAGMYAQVKEVWTDSFAGAQDLPAWVQHNHLLAIILARFSSPVWICPGMAVGAVLTAALGAAARPRGVPAGQEPLYAFPLAVCAYLYVYDKLIALSVLTAVVCTIYLLAIGFRLAAVLLSGWGRGIRSRVVDEPAGGWPVYTVLVPLYREQAVAEKILAHLQRFDYPQDKLDVIFLLEANDPQTLEALGQSPIPPWIQVVVVPDGAPRTKPRACNHGLARARGEFLVIFDAEDRPDPDQLKQAVLAFRNKVRPQVACLQAHLAYHNHDQNLLTRWFTSEYNVWFRRYLPGLMRLGGPIPLGGTSNHFRTEVLRQLGGWDPFNVTEDCDLGVRLAIAGQETRILDSTTWEEANSRLGNWIRQRSRWLKGYMITHLVWSRRPWLLPFQLGPVGAIRYLLAIAGVGYLAVLNLALWVMLGVYLVLLGHDLAAGARLWDLLATRANSLSLSGEHRWSWPMIYLGRFEDPVWSSLSLTFFVVSVALLAANLAFVLINALGGRRADQRGLFLPALFSPIYWILISLGGLKGFWQLLIRPHYWEKTLHGLDQPRQASLPAGPPPAAPAVAAQAPPPAVPPSAESQAPTAQEGQEPPLRP